jgi:U6 snRNA-associated Sm-like protein LSm3
MVLGDVEETHIVTETDAETGEQLVKKVTRSLAMLFVRGDIVTVVAPPIRTS